MANYSTALLRFDGSLSLATGSTPVKIKGSNGADTVTISRGVEAILDGSFNRGNDVINFEGLASSYSIVRLNASSIQVTDAFGTAVTIPVGTVGSTIQFADASRELKGGASGITLGTQTVAAVQAPVAAGSGAAAPFAPNADAGTLPGADANAFNVIVLAQDAKVTLGADSDPTRIRGSNGADTVQIAEGSVVILDGSFNRGNDTIVLQGNAADYSIQKSGSSAVKITDAAGTSVTIPVGTAGTTIQFADAARELVGSSTGIVLGAQTVGAVASTVAAGQAVGKTFTLTENIIEGTASVDPVYREEVYWGYTPASREGDLDGVPLSVLVDFVTTITGLDLTELGLIDDDGVGPFDNITNLEIKNALSLTGTATTGSSGNQGQPLLEITYADGRIAEFNIEAQISEQYFSWLTSLLLDSDGNSRLFMKQILVSEGTEGTADKLVPIVLTPGQNNGGTVETGKTGSGDDLIVAGRLELLHQAYIDGGAGRNTLQIDAKGTFAQPLELLNIQEVHVIDLPNYYTTAYGEGDGYLENTATNGAGLPTPVTPATNDSYIDLSNAHQIDTLVVTDQGGEGNPSGNLYIMGVQNGATLRLEGAFVSGTTTVSYGPGINADGDGKLNVELAIGATEAASINIVQNLDAMEIKSEGVANNLDTFFGGGNLSALFITGTGHFAVDQYISNSFDNETPITIDASANTGGVDLRIGNAQNYTIVGSGANDRFVINTIDQDNGPSNDETVTITGGVGDNYYEIDGADVVTITNANGNNNYEVTGDDEAVGLVTISAGNGNNKVELDSVATANVALGNGNNRVEITSVDSDDNAAPSATPDYPSNVSVVAGNGNNTVIVQADSEQLNGGFIDIQLGAGRNEVAAFGRAVEVTATGTGANVVYALGEAVTVDMASSNGSTIVVGGSGEDFAAITSVLAGNTTASDPRVPTSVGSSVSLDSSVLLDINAGRNATVVLGLQEGEQGNIKLTALPGSEISGANVTLNVLTTIDLRAVNLNGLTGTKTVILDDDNFDAGDAPTANSAIAGVNASVLTLTDKQFASIGAANFQVDGAVFNTHSFIKIIVTETTSLSALGVDALPRNIDLILELKDGVTLTMTAQQLHERVAQEGVLLAEDGNTDVASGKVIITNAGTAFDPFNTTDKVSSVIDGATYYGGSLSAAFDNGFNYQIRRGGTRYDRPADFVGEDIFYIDSADGPQEGFSTISTGLLVTGDSDVVISGVVELGEKLGESDKPFDVYFADLEGSLDITIGNFEQLSNGGSIVGNADLVDGSEVKVVIENDNDSTEGFDDNNGSLVMSGVEKLTVVQIKGTGESATIRLGDTVEDLETIAFRGNFNDTLIVEDAAWGLTVELQGGSRAAADGPTGTANVGTIDLTFEQPGAAAVVNLTHSLAGDTRAIKAYGVEIKNAGSITVNTGASSATIDSISGDISSSSPTDIVTKLVFNSDANVTLGTALDADQLASVDASGVTGNFTATAQGAAGANGFVFNAADGVTTLTLSSFTGGSTTVLAADDAATFNLVTSGAVVLNTSSLSGVDAVTIGAGSTATLTAAQALAVALADINGSGVLNITALGSQAFNEGLLGGTVSLGTVTTASGAVTLDPATNLAGAEVRVTGSLTLTADQFMALDDLDGATAGRTINITGVTQAHIDAGFTLAGVSNASGTVSFVGDVNLAQTTSLNGFAASIQADATLGIATQGQADGLDVTGPAGSEVKFLFNTYVDPDGFGPLFGIDVSGYQVGTILISDLLLDSVPSNNIDSLLRGINPGVVKAFYNDYVQTVDQTVTLEAGTVLRDVLLVADRVENNVEIANFTLNLQGGNVMGGLRLSNHLLEDASLIKTFLKTVTINSTGTTANPVSGETTNIILGDIDAPNVVSPFYPGDNQNDLLDVTINATQALDIRGTLNFNRVATEDGIDRGDSVAKLTVTGTADVNIGEIDTADADVVGVDVVNNGTGTLTVGVSGANIDPDDDLSFTGTGDIVLQVNGGTVDLRDDDLSAVSGLVIENGATVELTMAQADAIGAGNITSVTGGTLELTGLADQPFALANYDDDINVSIVEVAALPVVTLNPATNLTGITGLVVPEGTVLNLTAAQFQQLSGIGTITGVDADGNASTDFTVNITGLTQAAVGAGLNLSGVEADNATITLAGDVVLSGPNNILGTFDVNIGANKLTLSDIQQADGIDFTGSTLEFSDPNTTAFEDIDASGFAITQVRFLNTLTFNGNRNIDDIFTGLPEAVLKVVYQNEGSVDRIDQTVTVEAGTTVFDSLTFNPVGDTVELENFTLNLSGGVNITGGGNIRLSTGVKEDEDGNELFRTYLKKVTINSTGTEGNFLTGDTANIIGGDITPESAIGGVTNNLLDVTINASQDLIVRGNIVFASEAGDDGFLANDNDSATAVVTVTGAADVTLGGINLTDGDVVGFSLVHNGTGVVSLTIDNDDANEDLSFTGTGDVALTTVGAVDLSDDVLTAVSQITVNNSSALTLTQAQFDALGGANIIDGGTPGLATLTLVEFGSGAFNATTIDSDFEVNLVLANSNVTLNGNFTGVDSIVVQEGTTLTLTAQQYMQLQAAGATITGADTDGDTNFEPYNVVITGLTQAEINAGFDLDMLDVNGGTVTISQTDASVTLTDLVGANGDTDITTADNVQADFVLTNGQELRLANADQADDLTVNGTGNTTVTLWFDIVDFFLPGDSIGAAGYNVTTLKALNTAVNNLNVETAIEGIPSSTTLVVYHDPAEIGYVSSVNRVVVIEEAVTVPGFVVFNDNADDSEIRTLNLTLSGGSEIDGNLRLSTTLKDPGLIARNFGTLTINSIGTAANLDQSLVGNTVTANVIDGNITGEATNALAIDNTLANVIINGTQNLIVDGAIRLSSVNDDITTATFTNNNTAGVSVDQFIVAAVNYINPTVAGDDAQLLETLNFVNNGAAVTITGSSPAIEAEGIETILFSGSGDFIVGDADLTTSPSGVSSSTVSLIDASALTGDLALGELINIDNNNFSFISGEGVTTLTLTDAALSSAPVNQPGWSFDFSDAAAGSAMHIAWSAVTAPAASELTIDMGPDGVLYIDNPTGGAITLDFSALDLDIDASQIVLGDKITLVLTAAQADGLTIVPGVDVAPTGFTGIVNIVGLGDEPVDLSGITPSIAGFASLEDDDVTLDVGTILGGFGITLIDEIGDSGSLAGNTIRMTTVEQADGRRIDVAGGGVGVDGDNVGDPGDSSTNVVWLFENISAPLETKDYDTAIGRLWLNPDLINNEGGDVENLFTTLPSTILRVEFSSLTELNVLLNSNTVDRIVEFVHFTELNDLKFSDVSASPEEHLRTLDLRLGGEVTIGDIELDDVVNNPASIDPTSVSFDRLTINSYRAVKTGETLAAEAFVNNNNGIAETVGSQNENQIPGAAPANARNEVGDIFVGGDNGIDLLEVFIDTHLDRATDVGNGNTNNNRGEAISIDSITYDYDATTLVPTETALLDVTGANNISIGFIDTSDAQITGFTLDMSGFTAVFDPEMRMNATETFTIVNDAMDASDNDALAIFQSVHGNELSTINVSGYDGDIEMVISQVDSTNDDSTPGTPANDGVLPAFTYLAGSGIQTITVGSVGAFTPTLNTDQDWIFDFTGADAASTLTIDDSTVFQASADLTIDDAQVYITGDVDLSQVDLTVTGTTKFHVAAGNSLTISVAQALQLAGGNFVIVGEGTVFVEGDGTDVSALDLGESLRTAVVDLSGVTLDLTAPVVDADGELAITLLGGRNVADNAAIGQTVIGSNNDDNIAINSPLGNALDYVFDGGLGDDTYEVVSAAGQGDFTYLVKSGTDTIVRLVSEDPNGLGWSDGGSRNDVVVVSSGATAEAQTEAFTGLAGFVATTATSNAGTFNINGEAAPFNTLSLPYDFSDAAGPNGYNITGNGNDTIVGSAFDDVINGGNSVYAGAVDTLTGGDGADDFVFDSLLQSAATLSVTTVAPVTNIDRELITLTADDVESGNESLTVTWNINSTVSSVTVNVAGFATDLAQVRTAVITAINQQAGVVASAGAGAGDILMAPTGVLANENLEINSVGTGGTVGTLAGAISEPVAPNLVDRAQVTTVTVSGTPTPGDKYSIVVNNVGGGGDSHTTTAVAGPLDSAAEIAADLAAGLISAGFTIAYTPGNEFFTITDANPDNGGFVVAPDTDAVFGGSGVSSINLTGALSDLDTADVITDFTAAEGDRVVLNFPSLGAFVQGPATSEYAGATGAWNAASTALNGTTTQYYFTSVADFDGAGAGTAGGGLLFFDANMDGDVDGVLILEGVTNFSSGFIA